MVEEYEKRRLERTLLDKDLVKRTLKGDNAAFAELVKAYYRIFFALALEYVHDAGKAEDVVQEGWIEIYKSLRNLKDREKFGPWAYTIIRRQCVKEIHDTRRESKAMTGYSNEQYIQEKMSKAVNPQHERIMKAMSRLPKGYREVAVLHFFDELESDEIAKRLEMSLSLVYVNLHRAKNMLKELLQEDL
jgi:RNA polymerase sigma-70 factor, ECF subfamily